MFSCFFVLLAAFTFLIAQRGAHQPSQPRTFQALRNSVLFVDKSELIQEFLGGIRPRHWMMKARRGSGRTTTLDMIRRFAEIDPSVNGTTMVAKKSHKNFYLFADPLLTTGKPPAIFRSNKAFFRKHFGAYPVIWLDLDPQGVETYDELAFMRQLLLGPVRAAFQDHAYLLNSTKISSEDKELLKRYLFLDPSTHESFFRAYPPSDVVALADNVDAPLREVILDPEQDTDQAFKKLEILGGLIEAITEEDPDTVAAETRRTIIAFSMLPDHTSVLYTATANHFVGFAEADVRTLAASQDAGQYMDKIRDWYGGWGVKTHPQGDKYNPFSVVSFLLSGTKKFKAYWPELGSLETFKTVFSASCFGERFLECYRVCEFRSSKIGFWGPTIQEAVRRIKSLQRIYSFSQCLNETALYPFVDLLENLGYLKFAYYEKRYAGDGCSETNCYFAFRVPNLEVKSYISRLLYDALVSELPLNNKIQFRTALFEAIFFVDGSEASMKKFTDSLVALYVASESGFKAANATVANSVRVHLLQPPAGFHVKYVKTGRNEEELKRGKSHPDFELVFVVQTKTSSVGFVVKIDSVQETSNLNQILNDDYLDVFRTGDLKDETDATTVKVIANLSCDRHFCQLCYLYNDTRLDHEKYLEVEKDCKI